MKGSSADSRPYRKGSCVPDLVLLDVIVEMLIDLGTVDVTGRDGEARGK